MKTQPKIGRPNNRGKSTAGKRSVNESKRAGKKRVRPLTPKQFVHIIEQVSDGLVVLDKDWHYVYVNQKAAEMLQRQKPSDLIGKHIWTEYPEGVGQPFQLTYEKAMREQTPIVFEEHYEPWDLWFENRIYPSPDTLTILFTEITERKRMERLLEQRQHLLQKILDTEPGTVYIYDLEEHRNVYVNRHWLSEFGYTAEETQAMGNELLARIFHPDDLELISAHHKNWRHADEGDIREIEYRVRTKTGEWRWLHSHEAVFTHDGSGKVKQILGISYEITPRKLAQEALRRSEQQLAQIYDTVSDIIFLLSIEPDDRYRFISVNKAFLQATSLSSDQVVGRYADEIIPPASHLRVFGNYKKAIQERVPVIWEDVSEYPAGTRTVIVTVNAVYNEAGICTHLVGASHDITERKKMEDAVLRERDFSEAMLNSLPGVFYFYDQTGKFLRWNSNFEEISGYSAGEIAQMHPLDFFEGGEKDYIAERIQQVFDRGESDAEANFTAKDRSLFPYYFTGKRIEIDGQSYLIGMGIDISERKRADMVLREREKQLSSIYDTVGDVIFQLALESEGVYRFTSANQAFFKTTGVSREMLLGKRVDEIIPEPSQSIILQKYREAIETGKITRWEEVSEYPTGALTGEVSIAPVFDDHGRCTHLVGAVHDITERKRAEQENRMLLHNLKERVKELTALHNTARMQQQEGADIPSVVRELASLLPQAFQYPEMMVARIQLGQSEAMTPGFTSSDSDLRTEFMTADGQTGSIEIGYIQDCPPEVKGSFLVEERSLINTLADMLRTFHDRKQAEERLQRLNEELEQRVAQRTEELAAAMVKAQESDRLKSAFLASMSHELRTPLNSIIGFTGVILQGLAGPLNEEQTKQLNMTRDSARHLLALINDILDISKIEAGQLEILKHRFDMREAIAKALQVVQPLLSKKKDVQVRTLIGPNVGTMNQDRRRVEQVLINLINNAIKFTERGEVMIECQVRNGQLETCVHDTGIGIKPEDMHRLFKPFQQIDMGLARGHEGTGLGLSICQRLVTAMGGEIEIESQWNAGSTFKFTLPME